jgi:hypothetical protein
LDWLKRNSENIAFTFGYLAFVAGCWLYDPSFGLIAFGGPICALLIWKRTRPAEPEKQEGGDNA